MVCCWRILHSVWSAKTYLYPIFTLLYLTQPASLPTLLSTIMPRVKKEEFGSLSESERQKLQRHYTQGFAALGSVHNLEKAAKPSPSKVGELLHSKTSYTKFTQATRKFKRMGPFARFKDEIWCMNVAYVVLPHFWGNMLLKPPNPLSKKDWPWVSHSSWSEKIRFFVDTSFFWYNSVNGVQPKR